MSAPFSHVRGGLGPLHEAQYFPYWIAVATAVVPASSSSLMAILKGVSGGWVRPDGGSAQPASAHPRYSMHMGVSVKAYRTIFAPPPAEPTSTVRLLAWTSGMAVRRHSLPSVETSSGEAAQHAPWPWSTFWPCSIEGLIGKREHILQ